MPGTFWEIMEVFRKDFPRANYASLQALQDHLNQAMFKRSQRLHHEKNDTIHRLMLHEKAIIKKNNSLPKKDFIYFETATRKVNNKSMICFDCNYYSVPEEYKGERVIVRSSDTSIRIMTMDKVTLAKYTRCYGRKQKFYRVWNVLYKLQQKSAGFNRSREMYSMPGWLKKIYRNDFYSYAEEFIGFLTIIKDYPKSTVKRMLKHHRAFNIPLTVESVWQFLTVLYHFLLHFGS